jgi:hypothetical protein
VVDAELFSVDELKEQVDDLLQAYRRYHDNIDDMEDDGELADCEEGAQVAEDTFRAMFRGRFDDDEDWLRNRRLSTLQRWARDLRPSRFEGQSTGTLSDCKALLMRLTSERIGSEEGVAIWPYVRKIKVFLNAHILSQGLVLVDLPGMLSRPCLPTPPHNQHEWLSRASRPERRTPCNHRALPARMR